MINTKYVQFVTDGTPAQPVIVVDSIDGNGIVYPVREWDGVEPVSVVTPVVAVNKPIETLKSLYINSDGYIRTGTLSDTLLIYRVPKNNIISFKTDKNGAYATFKDYPFLNSQSEQKARTLFTNGFLIDSNNDVYLAVNYRSGNYELTTIIDITYDTTVPCDNIFIEEV